MSDLRLPTLGQTFAGRYELRDELGKGGMGSVYLAFDRSLARNAAVKVLRPVRGEYSESLRARFAREARAIGKLSDAHTVTLYDYGTSDDGLLYMVFEYVPGRDLRTLIEERGRLDPETTVAILIQVLEALREAHQAGLTHRDIKPENIRVAEESADGLVVKLLDFGIARTAEGEDQITRDGELVGTPRYMSPEQLTQREIAPASDLYSLGIVAYEMLMGADALQGSSWADQLERLMTGHVFSIPEIERIGAPLIAIVNRMTARELDRRYRTADEALAALRAWPGEEMDLWTTMRKPALALTTGQRVARTVSEIPPWMWVALVAVLGVCIYLAVSLFSRDDDPPPTPRNTRHAATSLLATTPTPVTDAPDIGAPDPRLDAGTLAEIGCETAAPPAGFQMLSHQDGLTRYEWLTYVPTGYEVGRPHALIVAFHEDAQTPRELIEATKLTTVADAHHVVLVAPGGGSVPAWDAKAIADAAQAVAITREQLCVDPARIFAFGHGPGGRAAASMPCTMRVAAVATSSYQQWVGASLCHGFDRVPYLSLKGLEDRNIPVEGGAGCSVIPKLSLAEHEALYRKANACTQPRSERSYRDGVCYSWQCEAPFVSCHIEGGRGWPGTSTRGLDLADCDGEPADFPYLDVMWKFFEDAMP